MSQTDVEDEHVADHYRLHVALAFLAGLGAGYVLFVCTVLLLIYGAWPFPR